MKKTPLAIAAVCIGLMFVACQKDELAPGKHHPGSLRDSEQPGGGNENEEDVMASWFAQNRDAATQVFEINPQEGGEIWGEFGTHITIAPGGLTDMYGGQLDGTVIVRLLEVLTPAHHLLFNRPTESSTYSEEEGVMLLSTGGSIDLSIEHSEGTPITASDVFAVMIEIPSDNPDGNMQLWQEAAGLEQQRDNPWTLIEEDPVPDISSGLGYRFPWRGWRRCNVDKSMGGLGVQSTSLNVDLPPQYDEMNAEIFVAFPNDPNLIRTLASMDRYDHNMELWSEHGGLANVGQELTLIAVGYDGAGQMQVAIVDVVVQPDHVINIDEPAFIPMDANELTNAINSLY